MLLTITGGEDNGVVSGGKLGIETNIHRSMLNIVASRRVPIMLASTRRDHWTKAEIQSESLMVAVQSLDDRQQEVD